MDLFDRFLQERTYLKGVSPQTLCYYHWVGKAFQPILTSPAKEGMLAQIQRLLASGVSRSTVNTYLRGFKAYIRWLEDEGLMQRLGVRWILLLRLVAGIVTECYGLSASQI